MAITITQGISGIYPVYNDSYIKFTSGLTNLTYAEITVPQYTNPFRVYPDLSDEFLFNFKDIVKATFNENGFNDLYYSSSANGESIVGTYTTQSFDITVYTTGSTEESLTGSYYEFFKSVKQIGETTFDNTTQILNYSTNGVDYYLTYFEGYPYTVDLLRVNSGDSVKVVNLNSNVTSSAMVASSTDAFRLYIDKATENWTTTAFLPLYSIVNKLEIKVNDTFKTNLNLKRNDAECGVYLKWFNNQGGYSYWLFDEFYKRTIKTKDEYEISTNSFNNVGSLVAPTLLSGISGKEELRVKTRVDKNEAEVIKGLFTSPSVQIYSQREPWLSGEWINVQVGGDFSMVTKNSSNEISCTISLPELITPKL